MSAKGLARVAALYGQIERVRLVELQQAAAAVAEAEALRLAAEAAGEERRGEGRAALARGEMEDWRLALDGADVELVRAHRAEGLRVERDGVRAAAGEAHRVSRRQTGQVERLLEQQVEAEELLEGRRAQAASDDRFAARLCWSRMKAG